MPAPQEKAGRNTCLAGRPALEPPHLQGAWWIGDQSLYSVNGYLFEISEIWAAAPSGAGASPPAPAAFGPRLVARVPSVGALAREPPILQA